MLTFLLFYFDKINFLITIQQMYDKRKSENLSLFLERAVLPYVAKMHDYICVLFQTMDNEGLNWTAWITKWRLLLPPRAGGGDGRAQCQPPPESGVQYMVLVHP